MIYAYKDYIPVVHPTAFVHPQATVTGHVVIGADVYIAPGACIRGDWGGIHIADGCNVQENCTIHMFPGIVVKLEHGAHIGHGAVIHGARIGKNVLVGMNAVVMDEAIIGANSIIGALTLVKARMEVPPRSLVVGNPGKVIRELDDKTIEWKRQGTKIYQQLPEDMRQHWREVEPLTEVPDHLPEQKQDYKIKGG